MSKKEIKHYDVFVIGSGVAGQTVAKACIKKNRTVAIADKREYGGTCSNRGCDPKKVLFEFSTVVEKAKRLNGDGVSKMPKINWKKIQKFKDGFVQNIPDKTEKNLEKLGIDMYHQSPNFINENEIEVEGKRIRADYFVIATGKTPRSLDIKGRKHLETSESILNLDRIPISATFIGSGYVGMEFAHMLAILGCKVTMIERGSKALAQFDHYLVEKIVAKMEDMGIKFIFDADVKSVEKLRKNLRLEYKQNGKIKTLKSRRIFNTAGRVPAVEMLDLDKANVDHDESGVLVNDYLQNRKNKKVYACGDVSSLSLPLTPLSGLQGHIVGANILNGNKKKFQYPLVPSTVFTQPNIASVGLSEKAAKQKYKKIKVYQDDASEWFNAEKSNQSAYAYKIITNARTGIIVGAHILSDAANENINIFTMAIHQKMKVKDFKKLIFTYPSFSNDLKKMVANK